MIGEICQIVRRAIDAGQLPTTTDPEAAFHVLWGAIHGPATVALCERVAPGEDADALARDILVVMLAGLRAGVPIRYRPCICHDPSVAAAGPTAARNGLRHMPGTA